MNTDVTQPDPQAPAAPPAAPPDDAAGEQVEITPKVAMAGRNFSWRPGRPVSVARKLAERLIAKGQATLSSEADKASAAGLHDLNVGLRDASRRADQAVSNARLAVAEGDAAKREARRLKLLWDEARSRVETLEADNVALHKSTEQQECAIGEQRTLAQESRESLDAAERSKLVAVDAFQTKAAALDENREALEIAEGLASERQTRIAKLTDEVANRDAQIAELQKKAGGKKPR